jgi:hypothetical protein
VRRFTDTLRKGCGEMKVDYVPFSTRQEFDQALAGFLAHRQTTMK